MFQRTTAVNKILAMTARKKVIRGGTSSGKTYAIIPILIDKAIRGSRLKITIVAETLPAVKEGAMDIFYQVMIDTNRWDDSCWNASSLTYTFKNSRSRIQFKSFDTEGKAKAAGKRDILFINECNHVSFKIADSLMIRSKEIYLDYNPDNEFWVDTEVLTEPNSELLTLTYVDNEGLPAETLEDLLIKKRKAFYDTGIQDELLFDEGNVKSEYWSNWWRVYGLGLPGRLQGVVFNDWKRVSDIPTGAKFIARGLDFGYTNDPTASVDIWEHDGVYYWDEVIYQTGLSNSEIGKLLKARPVDGVTYADSSEPKSINELRGMGVRIAPVDKGPDSVNFGIQLIQERPFCVTARSKNIIFELNRYKWLEDRDGNSLNKPVDAFNHTMDAARYGYMMKGKYKRNTAIGGR